MFNGNSFNYLLLCLFSNFFNSSKVLNKFLLYLESEKIFWIYVQESLNWCKSHDFSSNYSTPAPIVMGSIQKHCQRKKHSRIFHRSRLFFSIPWSHDTSTMAETNGGGRGRGYVAREPEQKVKGFQMKFRFVVLHNMYMKFEKKKSCSRKTHKKNLAQVH